MNPLQAKNNLTDMTLFAKDNDDDDFFRLSMDEIGRMTVYHSTDNANVPATPESTNLMIAGILKREYALRRIFSKNVVAAHSAGNLHLHDLQMPDRSYCSGHSPSYVAKYGLSLPNLNSIAKPAKHADVLLEQLIKFAASMQGHFSGAIGFDAVNMFLAPYLVGMDDAKMKQMAQILVYEFAQQAVARGGQSCSMLTRIIVRNNDTGIIEITTIGEFCHRFRENAGEVRFTDKKHSTPSLNRLTGKIEWKSINGIFIHIPATQLKTIRLSGGRDVIVTDNHSLFSIDADGNFFETTAKDNNDTLLIAKQIAFDGPFSDKYSIEEAWAVGAMIGDGCVNYRRDGSVSAAKFFNKNEKVMERMSSFIQNKFGYKGKIHPSKNIFKITMGEDGGEFFKVIGRRAENKKIPNELLSAPDETVMSLLAGLIDTDGGVSRNRFEYYTTSEELQSQIQFLLSRLGFRYSIRIRNEESNFNRNYSVFVIQISAEDSLKIKNTHSIRILPKGLIGDCSKHDFSIMRDYLKKRFGKGISSLDFTFRTSWRKIKYNQLMKLKDKLPEMSKYENILPFEVKSITNADEEEFVYDIGVDDNENFILANGIIAHNSTFSDLNLYWEIPKHYQNVIAIGPGGKETGIPYKEYDAQSKQFMRALMKVYLEGDGNGRPFFFPKADCHITADSVMDDEYMNLLGEVASVQGNPYFVFDRGNDPSISQCCFDELTKVLIRDDDGARIMNIKDVRLNDNMKVFHNGSWVKFKRVETSRDGKKMFKIRTVHGKELIATEDHLFPTIRGDLRADNLSINDYVLFNTRTLQNEPHYEQGMTYEQGVLIGAFLGDGSFNSVQALNFSLDETSYNQLKPLIEKGYKDFTGEERTLSMKVDGKLYACYIGANNIGDCVRKWINGHYAMDKSPNLNCLKESMEFRNGLIDGWEMTDGGNSHRIYSISKEMIDGYEVILNSLGIPCRIDISDRRDEPVIIRGEVFKRNYPLYCLRMYDTKVHRNKEGVFKVRNNSMWFKIDSIEELVDYDRDTVYCFDVENTDEPYFTMPSGWIVHNCRLRLTLTKEDINDMKIPWHSRFTALQNISMNLPGIAYAAGNERLFLENLYENMMLAQEAHEQKLNFFNTLMNLGVEGPLALLTMDNDGYPYIRYDKMKMLIGFVGLNEAVQILTGEELHQSKEATLLGLKIVSEMTKTCKEVSKNLGFATSLEQTPAESTSHRFARLDVKRFNSGILPYIRGNIQSNEIYYTNSSHMNIAAPLSPIERVKMEGKYHPFIEAGSISHVWLGENRPDPTSIAAFVRKTYEHTQNSQIAFSPTFTICNVCNTTSRGLLNSCPSCHSTNVDGITRITGFMSKISGWNAGKLGELRDRYITAV